MYGHPEENDLPISSPNTITYVDLKKNYPKEYKIHIKTIKECLESGFKV